jgi:hypothetical protein
MTKTITFTMEEISALMVICVSPHTVASALFPDEERDERHREYFAKQLNDIRVKLKMGI